MKNLADLLTGVIGQRKEEMEKEGPVVCPSCQMEVSSTDLFGRFGICERCRFHFRLSARQRIEQLADEQSFRETNRRLVSVDPLSFSDKIPYRQRLEEAQRKTGLTEAVVTGTCKIGGRPTVLVAMDFHFMGGSMGSVVGEKVTLAFELAIKEKLPIVIVAAGGGARMQEGMLSLMQMAKTASAAQRLHNARLPYISVLTDPTTGGIYASFASLADVIIAEHGALIGFAGPRVAATTTGSESPSESRIAESLFQHGMIDLVVDRTKLRTLLILLLEFLEPRYRLTLGKKTGYPRTPASRETAWETVQLARHQQRPTALDYIGRMMSNFIELHGDRLYGDDGAIVGGVADLSGQPVVVIGQERGHEEEGRAARHEGRARPEGYRKAQRLLKLAAKFRLPVVTLVDTPGADPSMECEKRGIGLALAHCLALMAELPTPVISAVIGEGGSGGALAIGLADRVLMMEKAIYSVISPEGGAVILYRDATRAEELAPSLKITAQDCKSLGVIDVVVPEPEGGAHTDPDGAAWQLRSFLLHELLELQELPTGRLLKNRYKKFRQVGQYNSYFKVAVSREVAQLQGYLHRGWEHLKEYLPHRGAPPGPLDG